MNSEVPFNGGKKRRCTVHVNAGFELMMIYTYISCLSLVSSTANSIRTYATVGRLALAGRARAGQAGQTGFTYSGDVFVVALWTPALATGMHATHYASRHADSDAKPLDYSSDGRPHPVS
jgi:hypothetical protein